MGGYVPVLYGRAADRPDEADTLRNAEVIAGALTSLGYDSDLVEIDFDLTAIEKLAKKNPLAVFNLVEAIRGDGAVGHVVCSALDHFGLAYTGAGTAAYFQSISKILSKSVLRSAGLPTPDFWLKAAPPPDAGKVIIKSVTEHASFGMDQNSVVDAARAQEEIAFRERTFGGVFFTEEYIPGREFNIAVLEMEKGPQVLPMAEMTFHELPEGVLPIVDYAAKWDEDSPSYQLTKRRFGVDVDEPALGRRLKSLTLACWEAADLSGYARVDFRVDEKGAPYILEFNTNPCLAPDAGFAAALEEAGMSYEAGVGAIVEAGLRARRR
jgi:D-alanine-D-alanine ligase